jgi:hypothetical protein
LDRSRFPRKSIVRLKNDPGALFVSQVLGSHAADRTQLFCYLKSCRQKELSTVNLWGGVDAMAAA